MVIAQGYLPAAQTVRLCEPSVGLDGFIVIHSTVLGPAAGGCRFHDYGTEKEAIVDACRLAEGMTYKNAMAGLPFGGGKAVLRKPAGACDRAALFSAFGEAVEALAGCYVTAEDVGTTVDDMRSVARTTSHVAGLDVARRSSADRAGGDPSPWTARGVFVAMEAAVRSELRAEIGDLRIAVQGVGNVGSRLCRLLAAAGARLTIADLDEARARALADELGADVVDIQAIVSARADVFAPCALGGALSVSTLPQLKARLVCGGANNQLASPHVGEMLRNSETVYVPDYVANAGGIISVSAEYLGENRKCVATRISQIGPRVISILAAAHDENVSPAVMADRMAQGLIQNSAKVHA